MTYNSSLACSIACDPGTTPPVEALTFGTAYLVGTWIDAGVVRRRSGEHGGETFKAHIGTKRKDCTAVVKVMQSAGWVFRPKGAVIEWTAAGREAWLDAQTRRNERLEEAAREMDRKRQQAAAEEARRIEVLADVVAAHYGLENTVAFRQMLGDLGVDLPRFTSEERLRDLRRLYEDRLR